MYAQENAKSFVSNLVYFFNSTNVTFLKLETNLIVSEQDVEELLNDLGQEGFKFVFENDDISYTLLGRNIGSRIKLHLVILNQNNEEGYSLFRLDRIYLKLFLFFYALFFSVLLYYFYLVFYFCCKA